MSLIFWSLDIAKVPPLIYTAVQKVGVSTIFENIFNAFFNWLIYLVTLYFKVSLLQCNYTFKYWVILINYMYLLYG